MSIAIGIDLGGTNIKGVLLNDDGKIIQQKQKPSVWNGEQGEEFGDWKNAVLTMVQEFKLESSDLVDAIGLAAPGIPNQSNSAIRVMPARLKGLENFIWSDFLNEKKVSVLNDAHAALMAEVKFGVGKNVKNIVMLTLGTGVGGAILIEGKLYQGNFQMAGHAGHTVIDADNLDTGITGVPGTLENAIGDATVLKRTLGKYNSTKNLVEAYQKGNPLAAFIWLDSVRKLALSITSLCNLLSPELIILSGGITKAGDALYIPLTEFLEIYEWKNTGKETPILQAQFSELAGAVGAAGFALDEISTWKNSLNKNL